MADLNADAGLPARLDAGELARWHEEAEVEVVTQRPEATASRYSGTSASTSCANLILEKMASEGRKEAMKKSRFTEEQMVKILREADRSPVPEVKS